MDYDLDIVPLMAQYQNMTLNSISGRADITIVDINSNGFVMTCSDDKEFTESHRRIRAVFNDLLNNGFTHVDAALKNSGSRRNVPETLLANLPFIEHGEIDNRKHLFIRNEDTHALGTLKQSD